MTKVQTFTVKGTKTAETILPKEFGVEANMPLLAQAVYVYEERGHVGLRKTKTRAEVNRTTKKIYKQKGTGGARHGSRRANLYVGGGVALGPRPVRRILTLSDKLKVNSKFLAYSLKAKEGELVAVSGLGKVEKTKEVSGLINVLKKSFGAKSFTFVLSQESGEALKFFRNLSHVRAILWNNVNAYDIFKGGLVVLDTAAFAKVEAKPVEKTAKKAVKKSK